MRTITPKEEEGMGEQENGYGGGNRMGIVMKEQYTGEKDISSFKHIKAQHSLSQPWFKWS